MNREVSHQRIWKASAPHVKHAAQVPYRCRLRWWIMILALLLVNNKDGLKAFFVSALKRTASFNFFQPSEAHNLTEHFESPVGKISCVCWTSFRAVGCMVLLSEYFKVKDAGISTKWPRQPLLRGEESNLKDPLRRSKHTPCSDHSYL